MLRQLLVIFMCIYSKDITLKEGETTLSYKGSVEKINLHPKVKLFWREGRKRIILCIPARLSYKRHSIYNRKVTLMWRGERERNICFSPWISDVIIFIPYISFASTFVLCFVFFAFIYPVPCFFVVFFCFFSLGGGRGRNYLLT